MPVNRKFQRNASAIDSVEEMMRRVKVEGNDENGEVGDEPVVYPDRPGEPDCIYYLRTGACGYGSNCRFNHPFNNAGGQVYGVKNTTIELPERAGQPDCGYYLKTGTCKYGSTCKYHHPKERQADVLTNMLGLPMRQDSRACPYYMRTGICKYGYACKFHHPQPALAPNVLPAVVGTVYGASASSAVPSSAVPQLSAKATYFPTSLQLPQSYMPLFISQSQGWNAYAGGMNHLSNGMMSASYLPERPDQPECRYFMNHGSCKYGPDCKYHHPREKLASISFGPLGLPLRPGQAICSHYNLYGICKYGPTCRFDHPMDGGYHPYAYSMSLPPLANAYIPNINNTPNIQRILPINETTSSNLSEWINNGAATASNNKNRTKSIEGDPSDSLPYSSKASSEVIHNESD
ncbi:hypothetical protein ABFS82_08G117600 [Erythranthe guttata]|uniref:C3H1-type domain-containing protein n=1 Tax=Erythranthe guttata TaxID=4155 RepID=A0A022RSU5_ERYGU|nr:PREDICTED: zinc finger CCCH domain-containing protein 66-like [Erythranthe guttata]EYU43139.1 hypothetical protein MIMGU_mgv1a007548mg [Erythranthe guttata]|eukprot:XP_012830113.1 PREDICTED: zinc finger CCCH domain-containing protein 66-like [Erythranthe guttata]